MPAAGRPAAANQWRRPSGGRQIASRRLGLHCEPAQFNIKFMLSLVATNYLIASIKHALMYTFPVKFRTPAIAREYFKTFFLGKVLKYELGHEADRRGRYGCKNTG